MARTQMPTENETSALVESRRRCCICFALNRDTKIKSGQIAHLDRSNSNHSPANLAFLCLNHHDEYDATTSQRKGFKIQEVKQYKEELLVWLGSALSQKVHFGILSIPDADPYAGQWVRLGSNESPAELQIIPLPDSAEGQPRYFVTGMAYQGMSREYGPNMGFLDFFSEIIDEASLFYSRPSLRMQGPATTELRFTDDGHLKVWEEDTGGQYGMGVTFDGLYRRVT
ncbi:hypothetical protein [Agrobacterium vitis]|uniref:hypothetical protein n=1 Tax=Agrobacterium vitis TaxID=373 RepID=UPI00157283BD|nr:hypothetical protein [Agrobacterium vitis]NSZ17733.1 hypothetical protein [Agrobacterium vitis]QZO03411.1 hypothetical protein K4831_13380 [Agrobacterium vitis]UJL88533.1 hypothetical protein AVF2S5_11720 [Agrobacterium vitis]